MEMELEGLQVNETMEAMETPVEMDNAIETTDVMNVAGEDDMGCGASNSLHAPEVGALATLRTVALIIDIIGGVLVAVTYAADVAKKVKAEVKKRKEQKEKEKKIEEVEEESED